MEWIRFFHYKIVFKGIVLCFGFLVAVVLLMLRDQANPLLQDSALRRDSGEKVTSITSRDIDIEKETALMKTFRGISEVSPRFTIWPLPIPLTFAEFFKTAPKTYAFVNDRQDSVNANPMMLANISFAMSNIISGFHQMAGIGIVQLTDVVSTLQRILFLEKLSLIDWISVLLLPVFLVVLVIQKLNVGLDTVVRVILILITVAIVGGLPVSL